MFHIVLRCFAGVSRVSRMGFRVFRRCFAMFHESQSVAPLSFMMSPVFTPFPGERNLSAKYSLHSPRSFKNTGPSRGPSPLVGVSYNTHTRDPPLA